MSIKRIKRIEGYIIFFLLGYCKCQKNSVPLQYQNESKVKEKSFLKINAKKFGGLKKNTDICRVV